MTVAMENSEIPFVTSFSLPPLVLLVLMFLGLHPIVSKALVTCVDCSGPGCARPGVCETDGKCFLRRDVNGLLYRGCADNKRWRGLDLSYNGCRWQNYLGWANTRVLWCLCFEPNCNSVTVGVFMRRNYSSVVKSYEPLRGTATNPLSGDQGGLTDVDSEDYRGGSFYDTQGAGGYDYEDMGLGDDKPLNTVSQGGATEQVLPGGSTNLSPGTIVEPATNGGEINDGVKESKGGLLQTNTSQGYLDSVDSVDDDNIEDTPSSTDDKLNNPSSKNNITSENSQASGGEIYSQNKNTSQSSNKNSPTGLDKGKDEEDMKDKEVRDSIPLKNDTKREEKPESNSRSGELSVSNTTDHYEHDIGGGGGEAVNVNDDDLNQKNPELSDTEEKGDLPLKDGAAKDIDSDLSIETGDGATTPSQTDILNQRVLEEALKHEAPNRLQRNDKITVQDRDGEEEGEKEIEKEEGEEKEEEEGKRNSKDSDYRWLIDKDGKIPEEPIREPGTGDGGAPGEPLGNSELSDKDFAGGPVGARERPGPKTLNDDATTEAPFSKRILCPANFKAVPHLRSCYHVDREPQTWWDAEKHCNDLDSRSHLVTLDKPGEYEYVILKIAMEPFLMNRWQGWWTGGKYDVNIREFVWSSTRHVISRLDPKWRPGLVLSPYTGTCVWLVPLAGFRLGNYGCLQPGGAICEVEV